MKYEYMRRVPVEKAATPTHASTKRQATSKSRKPADEVKKTEVSHRDKIRAHSKHSDDEYVYSSSHSLSTDGEEPSTAKPRNSGDAIISNSTSGHRVRKRTKRRRHTIPAAENGTGKPSSESLPPPASITQLQKVNTTLPASGRRLVAASAKSEVATSDTVSVRSASRKRSSSVFTNLFLPKPNPAPEVKVSCLTCGDDVVRARTAKLPCTHRMCHSCLKRIFKLSVTDPTHMPPKCCTDHHIDVKHVDKLFDDDFKKTYNRKFKEYKAKNRIYCPKKGCGQWIQPKHMSLDRGRKVGKCPDCKTYVCATCNQKMHKSRDCPEDPALNQFAEMAKQSGWQKCYNCSATVELKEGCNHMTCRCTAEFCMVCGLKWKSCDCPWFNYEQIDATGDPVGYQQEMDRRRDQEQRDAELARRLEAFTMDDDVRNVFGFGNATGNYLNPNFFRGFVNGLVGREAPAIDPVLLPVPQEPQMNRSTTRRGYLTTDPAEATTLMAVQIPVVRRQTHRRRRTARTTLDEQPQADPEHDQDRLIREWANDRHDE